ncbi:hypothetical protein JXA47_14515 [Candidatus Sumerlaeota bacterium]|nr:hypothetical protein [Candidatus Sumerlaeota bacterium]
MRTALILLALAALAGCGGSGSVSGDVYAMRLTLDNLQTYVQAADEAQAAQIRGLRASSDLQGEELRTRLDHLERELAAIKLILEQNLTPPRVRHELVVPPDRETETQLQPQPPLQPQRQTAPSAPSTPSLIQPPPPRPSQYPSDPLN